MCLQTSQKRAKRAKEDIIVYKLFDRVREGRAQSPYMHHSYNIGELNKTVIRQDNDDGCFDQIAQLSLQEAKRNGIRYKSIGSGFHSVKYPERLKNNPSEQYYGVILECIIPKGSMYYEGFSDLLVSNQIIVTDKEVKVNI